MEKIEVVAVMPVKSTTIYNDWLSSKGHTEMTGGAAQIAKEVGSKHTAWDGYISGEIIELSENQLIQMSWRTSEFDEGAEYSQLQITFEDGSDGCKITINQWNMPDGDGEKYKQGWQEYYFEPMLAYYSEE
ncbi:MAG: SRPBCC domain-containing protein [Flavobacteriales bacterium]|nr:SRPBCC domain-containing protein [Flavobacteriales bacterium]